MSVGDRSRAAHAASGSLSREWGDFGRLMADSRKKKRHPRGAPRSHAPGDRLRRRAHPRPRVGRPARAGDRARDRGAFRARRECREPARSPRPARGELHRAGRPRARRRGRRRDARPRGPREVSRVQGAGAQSAGARADAQGRVQGGGRQRHRCAEGRAPEQAVAARGDEPVSSRRSAVPRQTHQRDGRAERDAARPSCFAALGDPSGRVARCGRSPPRAATRAAPPNADQAANEALALCRQLRRPVRRRAMRSTCSSSTRPISRRA